MLNSSFTKYSDSTITFPPNILSVASASTLPLPHGRAKLKPCKELAPVSKGFYEENRHEYEKAPDKKYAKKFTSCGKVLRRVFLSQTARKINHTNLRRKYALKREAHRPRPEIEHAHSWHKDVHALPVHRHRRATAWPKMNGKKTCSAHTLPHNKKDSWHLSSPEERNQTQKFASLLRGWRCT
jgi:hypothetical protein